MTDTRTFRVVDEDGDYYEITGDPMDALNALTARVAELERELLALRGTELNPSPTILDAQSYGELRDEIAATMTDDWDGEDSEIYILIRYVRWLAAGMPRDEDGYPIRRESYPAAEAERDGDVRAVAPALRQEFGVQAEHSTSAFPTRTEQVARELAASYSRVREPGCNPTPHYPVTRFSSDWQRLPDEPTAALNARDAKAGDER